MQVAFAPKENGYFTIYISSIRLDFLGPGRFAAKTLIYGYWIFLDFLGFPRPNRDLSMGYTA